MRGTSSSVWVSILVHLTWSLADSQFDVVHREDIAGGYTVANIDDAWAICAGHGQHLATPDQLLRAHQKGFGQCRCGWLSDGSVRIPANKDACPPNEGVVKCSTNPAEANQTGWDVYCSTTDVAIMHRTSSTTYTIQTWEDARAICLKHGENMATEKQLLAAQRQGYHMGRCGWLADGSVKFPVTYQVEDSGADGSFGIKLCPSDPGVWEKDGFDVYCSTAAVPVVHRHYSSGNYKITSEEQAKIVCSEHGEVIATLSQLETAQMMGYDNCNCGWLETGLIYYPVTMIRGWCGSKVGLNRCPEDPKVWNRTGWDVYCSNKPDGNQDGYELDQKSETRVLPVYAIAIIAVLAILLLITVTALAVFFIRKRKLQQRPNGTGKSGIIQQNPPASTPQDTGMPVALPIQTTTSTRDSDSTGSGYIDFVPRENSMSQYEELDTDGMQFRNSHKYQAMRY